MDHNIIYITLYANIQVKLIDPLTLIVTISPIFQVSIHLNIHTCNPAKIPAWILWNETQYLSQ